VDQKIAKSFIAGQWLDKQHITHDIINPFSLEKIGEQYETTTVDIERALDDAYKQKNKVKFIPVHERANILVKASQLLEERKMSFATLLSQELGKPLKNTLDEVDRSIETLALSGEEAKRLIGETIPGDVSERGAHSFACIHRVPVGVIAAITPFNAPLNLVCHKIGPSFAAGNVTILKPAPQTSLIATAFIQLLLEAGLPSFAIHMVLGGVEAGQQIVSDDRVNVISFTGGLVASRNISKIAGLKKKLFELGGNAATIVHEDADIERAVRMCIRTAYSNSGQSCISVQRIYVHRSLVAEFTELMVHAAKQLKIGDPTELNTDIGTLVDEGTADRVINWIEEAVQEGAELLVGGKKQGSTVTPTILYNPKRESKVVCEEVFGPVVSIIPYEKIEEAIQEANDSPFGMQVGVFTNDLALAYKISDEIDVGGVVINGTSNFRLDHWPYGGVKLSGLGREGPKYAIQEMTESKMIVLRTDA